MPILVQTELSLANGVRCLLDITVDLKDCIFAAESDHIKNFATRMQSFSLFCQINLALWFIG